MPEVIKIPSHLQKKLFDSCFSHPREKNPALLGIFHQKSEKTVFHTKKAKRP
jgi:hypothetical protein